MTRTDDGFTPEEFPMSLALAVVLTRVSSSHRVAEAEIANRGDAIQLALKFGATWEDIGHALGMSRQSAHRHFAHHHA